uniref:Cingulin n=1 Tax=Paramormyrops kingsleyae TaxID=1676925 RepID=A0A3B3QR19_9TELE
MSAASSDQKSQLDYGVQIRFINDLHNTGGGAPVRSRGSSSKGTSSTTSSKYGVAVRVQGIAGQPYVVLKGGEKGDSFGVQLRSQPRDYNFPPAYNSLPRTNEDGEAPGPYHVSAEGNNLRRARSHGSLLEREPTEDYEEPLRRPPGDGHSGSYGNLDGAVGVRGDRRESNPMLSNRMVRANWTGSCQAGLNGSLDGEEGRPVTQYRSREAFPVPSTGSAWEQPSNVVDTNSLAPINRLINQFDGSSFGNQARGRPRALERLSSEERRRVRSLDAYENVSERSVSPSVSASPPDHHSSPLSSSTSPYSSPGRSAASVAKVTALPASRPNYNQSVGMPVARETAPLTQTDTQATPDLLKDKDQSLEPLGEADKAKQMIYTILRDGNNESVSATKRKVDLVFDKIQGLRSSGAASEIPSEAWRKEKRDLERKLADLQSALQEERRNTQKASTDRNLKAELEDCLDDNLQLKEHLDRKKTELDQAQTDLTQLRIERESAESRVRDLEDQMAGFQEELRRESDGREQLDLLHTELMSVRAELAEAVMVRQRQEEALRQRERELTALKGVLKDEVSSHDSQIEALREQYQQDMEKLRSSMEQVSVSQLGIEAERQRVNSTMRALQQQLEDCSEESSHWRGQFQSTRDELRSNKQELLQARLEKEELEEETTELQDRLTSMKEQMPDPSHINTLTQDLEKCRAELKQARVDLEKQKLECDKKRMELLSLKKTNQEQEADQKYEIDRLKDQSRKDKEDLAKALDKVKQRPDPSVVEELQKELQEWQSRAERLQEKVAEAEQQLQGQWQRLAAAQTELQTLRDAEQELQEANDRLKEKHGRLEVQLQTSASQSSETEQVLEEQIRSLRMQLEDSRRMGTRLSQEKEELSQYQRERERQREAQRKEATELEEQKRALERALDKINKEMEQLSLESQQQVRLLEGQLEEYKERCRKEVQDTQRQGRERQAELEKAQGNLRSLQEEVSRLKKELSLSTEERETLQLDKELLGSRLKNMEAEMESQRGSQTDRSREVRSLEDKVKHLQMEVDEERHTVELLTDRVSRSRDQNEQLRAELMQERSSKQDLELDKNSLERQIKDLKSRLTDMEGQSRSSAGYSQLESKVQELEDRLHSEEREKNTLLASQRRLERKLKELSIALDEERQQHTDQRDQVPEPIHGTLTSETRYLSPYTAH